MKKLLIILVVSISPVCALMAQSWTADNGNGTYTNPLFYDEFSDPDLIRVGDDFYLTGTTMHCMPGLPILHSKDLVNWKIIGYAFDKLDEGKVILRITGNYDKGVAQFSYSLDGETFIEMNDSVSLPYQLKTFQGCRYSLFAYNTDNKEGGYAGFDNFTVDEPMDYRSKNIPMGKVITLINFANDRPVWANPHGMLHWASPGSEGAKGAGCQFRVHDRGKGRVALEALNGTGFLTVVGVGLSGDVRLTKEEKEGSLFQWQDMLNNQCMLLSLKTNQYIGLMPSTREPYSANISGARPDRKDGSVFVWQVVNNK